MLKSRLFQEPNVHSQAIFFVVGHNLQKKKPLVKFRFLLWPCSSEILMSTNFCFNNPVSGFTFIQTKTKLDSWIPRVSNGHNINVILRITLKGWDIINVYYSGFWFLQLSNTLDCHSLSFLYLSWQLLSSELFSTSHVIKPSFSHL